MFLNFVFVFVYTVIRARAVPTSLDKKLSAEEFLFLSHGEIISSWEIVYTHIFALRTELNKEITLVYL